MKPTRKQAGRPPLIEDRVTVQIYLPRIMRDSLSGIAEDRAQSFSELARDVFSEFLKSKKGKLK
jgi:hypothetical protein